MTKKFYTLAEAVAEMEKWQDENEDEPELPDIAILPPADFGGISDEEFLDEDVLDVNNINEELPHDIAGTMEIILDEIILDADAIWDEDDLVPLSQLLPRKTIPIYNSKWSLPQSQKIEFLKKPKNIEFERIEYLKNLLAEKSPIELFHEFFDESVYNLILQQSNIYASQKNVSNFSLTLPYLKRFLGILLFSGHHPVPQEHLYWSVSLDYDFKIIRNAMPRSLFFKIKSNLHLADNNKIDASDKFYKVRTYMSMISSNCSKFGVFSHNLSIDESMWPYHGRHSCKMFIRAKPIRFGYKIWCMTSANGFLYKFFPYGGKSETFNPERGLGENVVRNLLEIVEKPENHRVYFDNFFSSHKLMAGLNNDGYFATGTVRDNRTGKCPLLGLKELKKRREDFTKELLMSIINV